MAISFRCSNEECGRSIKAPEHTAGRQAKCPACGTVLTIPQPASVSDATANSDAAPFAATPPQTDVVCGDCGQPVPAGAALCSQCGWVNPASFGGPPPVPAAAGPSVHASADDNDAPPDIAPRKGNLGVDCLTALTYGASNVRSIAKLVLYSIALAVLLRFLMGFALIFAVFGGIIVYAFMFLATQCTIGGYFLRFYLDCGISSLEGVDQAPDVPEFDLPTLFRTGLKGLGIACVYILPVVTFPLLPLGLLAWSYSDDWRAFDLRYALKAAIKRPVPLVTVWAIMILWVVACGSAISAADHVIEAAAGGILLGAEGFGGLLLGLLILALGAMVSATIFHFFMAVIFRCIGMLGRHHPELTEYLPEKDNPAVAIGFIVGGLVASAIAIYLLVWSVVSPFINDVQPM